MHLLELCTLFSALMLLTVLAEGASDVGKYTIPVLKGELFRFLKLVSLLIGLYISLLLYVDTEELVEKRAGRAGRVGKFTQYVIMTINMITWFKSSDDKRAYL